MKTSAIVVGLAVAAVIAVAGIALASGSAATALGMSPGTSDGQGSMWGQMGGGSMHGWNQESQYQGTPGECPMENDGNYSYGYENGYCPMHEDSNYSYQNGEPGVDCPMDNDWNYSYEYDYELDNGHCM